MSGSETATIPSADTAAPETEPVILRRHALLLGLVGTCGCMLSAAYVFRALAGDAEPAAWVIAAVLGLIGVAHLAMFVDARRPVLVADDTGVRVRFGGQWRGLRWEEIAGIEVRPRRRGFRDGRVVVSPKVNGHASMTAAYGAATQASTPDLAGALRELAAGRTPVGPPAALAEAPEPDGASRRTMATPGSKADGVDGPTAGEPVTAMTAGSLALADRDEDADPAGALPELSELRRSASIEDQPPEETLPPEDRVPAGAQPAAVGNAEPDRPPATERVAVIGVVLADARHRLGLSVEELSARTRIRAHVIEGIEVDEFGPCGGDFYARGHLRVLARRLGLDPGPLLDRYDDLYASAPINPRSVFEAELSTARLPRGAAGSPNWTALIAVVLALLLVWGIARLVTDHGPPGYGNGSTGGAGPVGVVRPVPTSR